jgi:hypothetical protein
MNRRILIGAGLILSFVLSPAKAQDSVLGELYGQGVHAYFAGDLRTAHAFLSNAISQGSRDPRCYFFRGLTYASLGRPAEAQADYKTGSELEASNTERVYPVSDSLQRVQGRSRLQIERQRQMARLTTLTKSSKAQQARYEEMKRSEKDVLRNPSRPAEAAGPGAIPAPMGGETSDPFAGAPAPAPEKAPEKPAAPATEPGAPAPMDPFGTTADAPSTDPAAPPATPPADESKDNPFADDKPAAPATPAPATPAEPPADDPFK